ncbi:EFR1 family ferrodoxin [uncultured Treponema sp.]|uniref:EFR1 family ferrodoxin n=1 Tax=Treponema sp. TaxID=166 RepID=UPI0025D6CC7A|nr:EFR1 family ferrodoxin [uncultured Treponema sp.]
MILYFSATGNSEYVAQRIAAETGDIAVSITDYYKKQIFSFDEKYKTLGIVSPTYSWGLPVIVTEFLQRLDLSHKPDYLFFIATYGTTPGQTGRFADNILAPKGLSLSAKFSVKMPDTWTPIFDLSNKEKVRRINDNAELEIDYIIKQIKNFTVGDFMKNKLPYPLAKIGYNIEYDSMRKTKHFSVDDTCIGCGLCAKKCPVQAIEMQNKRPVWSKEKCVMCLGCLHRCPKFAIQYGKNTKRHGQYTNPNVTV